MPRPQHVSCALFDFDGVIVDTEPLAARRNLHVFHELGVPVTLEECQAMAGCSGHKEIPALFERYGSPLAFDDFVARRSAPDIAETYLDPDLAVYGGLRELLARLRASGVACGLVSTTFSKRILLALDRFRLVSAFDVIVTGDLVTKRKPDPEPYLRGMELLGARPEETIVFEDSLPGATAGKASGAYVFGVKVSSVEQDVSIADETVTSYVGFDPLAGVATMGMRGGTSAEAARG